MARPAGGAGAKGPGSAGPAAEGPEAEEAEAHGHSAALPRRWPAGALLLQLAVGTGPLAATGAEEDIKNLDAGQVTDFLNGVSVYAVTDPEGAVALEPDNDAGRLVGRFYFSKAAVDEAFERIKKDREGIQQVEVRQIPVSEVYLPFVVGGDATALGGELRLEPPAKEVRHAKQILEGGILGPPGSVPLFMASELELQDPDTGSTFAPAFLYEGDLLAALKRAGAKSPSEGGPRTRLTTLRTITDQFQRGRKPPSIRLVESAEDIRDLSK